MRSWSITHFICESEGSYKIFGVEWTSPLIMGYLEELGTSKIREKFFRLGQWLALPEGPGPTFPIEPNRLCGLSTQAMKQTTNKYHVR